MTWYDNLILIGIAILLILVFVVLFKTFYCPLYNQTDYISTQQNNPIAIVSTTVSTATPVFQETPIITVSNDSSGRYPSSMINTPTKVPEPAVGPTATDLNVWFDTYNTTDINGVPYTGPNAYQPTNFTVSDLMEPNVV